MNMPRLFAGLNAKLYCLKLMHPEDAYERGAVSSRTFRRDHLFTSPPASLRRCSDLQRSRRHPRCAVVCGPARSVNLSVFISPGSLLELWLHDKTVLRGRLRHAYTVRDHPSTTIALAAATTDLATGSWYTHTACEGWIRTRFPLL